MTENGPDLDRLLDRSLEAWASVEPEPGLEERVLSRLRREAAMPDYAPGGTGSPRAHWPLLAAAAAILLAVGGVVLFPRLSKKSPPVVASSPPGTPQIPVPTPAAARPEAVAESRTAPVTRPASPPRRAAAPVRRSTARDVFPTPSKVREQERLLLAYVAATPLDEMKNHFGLLDPIAEETEGTKENR